MWTQCILHVQLCMLSTCLSGNQNGAIRPINNGGAWPDFGPNKTIEGIVGLQQTLTSMKYEPFRDFEFQGSAEHTGTRVVSGDRPAHAESLLVL